MADEPRALFGNWFSYILATIGFAVGLGNVWRFPKTCLENGGGAFLIPYFIVFFVEGIPLMMIELVVGQRFRGSPVHSYGRMNKYLWGIGVAMMFASLYTVLYYNTILAYAYVYFFNSFQATLPWAKCPEGDVACLSSSDPSQWFFSDQVAMTSSDLEDNSGGSNGFVWHVYFATLVSWVTVFLAMITGVKSLGKVVYFTALYPYVMLTVLLIIGVRLDGAKEGLKFLFEPDFDKLLEPTVWLAAAEQIFFSAGLGFGGLISMSSRMPVRNNAFLDTFVIMFVNSFTSLYASIGIFSIKGHMAQNSLEECEANNVNATATVTSCDFNFFMQENDSGTGLVFVAMAKAVETIGGSGSATILSILFYLMIITLGLDSAFGIAEGFVSVFADLKLLRKVPHYVLMGIFCIFGAAVSLLFSTTRGGYFIDIFDLYGAVYVLVIVGFFELVAVGWVHGIHNFSRDFTIVNDFHPFWIFKLMWKYISPIALFAAIVGKFVDDALENALLTYTPGSEKETYPWWAMVLCLFLFFSAVLPIPLAALISLCTRLNFGKIDYNEKEITSKIEPKEYWSIEQLVCCVPEEFDFPENIQLRYVSPEPLAPPPRYSSGTSLVGSKGSEDYYPTANTQF
ncbi:sodium-dependent neutral amino acid transporter B(0)AT3-like [Symsagittifera roscoffensis]|uniref:sodium-dependent neutral amino acid transporter B(0)AT3-like n=1 Tax=Symsagittifera roscoffensis TaxID=84072 RepID=UPI00307BCACE